MSKRKLFQIGDSLTEALEETAHAADNYSGQLRIEVLPLKKIEVDPDNPREMALDFPDISMSFKKNDPLGERKKIELESLQSMAESINRDGLINPIVVYKYGDKYRLVAGERRALASMLAKQEYIPAKILEKKPPELNLRLLQWVENVERENLSLWERLRNLEKIVDANASKDDKAQHSKITPTHLSKLIGCTLPQAMNYCYVLNADESIKKVIEENKIRNLEKAALVTQVESPMLRLNVMNACIEGATLKQMKNMILEYKQEMKNKKEIINVSNKAKRGRQATQIDLGKTKNIAGVKALVNLIVQKDKYHFLKAEVDGLDWHNFGEITKMFKKVLQVLEKGE